MKNGFVFFVLIISSFVSSGQGTRMIIVGDVKDADTAEPLAYATIGLKGHIEETVSNAEGKFELSIPTSAHKDTLVVTYVGYGRFEKALNSLSSFEHVLLKQMTTVLDEIHVVHRQLDLRDIDRDVRIIRDNLYAMNYEVTNREYNDFLSWLDDYNKTELRKKHEFNLSGYEKSVQEFYSKYHKPTANKKRTTGKDPEPNYSWFPAVNITYEGAVEYCKWLTDRYNENPKKKKFKKVLFRLPTLNEWQIASLGYPKFQSWNLLENEVEVVIPKDSTTKDIMKGERKMIKIDKDILYPWYWVYYRRNTPDNQFGCYLGNFKIEKAVPCPANAPAYDGYVMMSPVGAYFPNNIGLYDVVGNVAEMIDEKGKACGGSWAEHPLKSTIQSVKNFSGPDETVGFRVFMEVLEK